MISFNCNLSELPLQTSQSLANTLTSGSLWMKLLDDDRSSVYYMSTDDMDRFGRSSNPGKTLLGIWGNRGQTVLGFLTRLQALSRHHQSALDPLQLILYRKFKAVRWSREEQILVSIVSDGQELRLECKAIGFPWPNFRWRRGGQFSENDDSPVLLLPRCACQTNVTYSCVVSNEVPAGFSYSDHYRQPGKAHASTITSKEIDISTFVGDSRCGNCDPGLSQLMRVGPIPDLSPELEPSTEGVPISDDSLIASDKVALIISNCVYTHLPELVTPLCDAETLAMALQEMKYKTVTLADLTLKEMKFVVKEYRKLLGNGVYAVFYFVGHGFEVNGQCYLLPIDAPMEAHNPECCLSMDWVLAELSPYNPALNLLLLDVCRKFIPFDCIPAFVNHAEQFKKKNKPNRNTVYGYSTSGGVGAYEVRGEVNGVFMKYLKDHIKKPCSVIDMLNHVLRDIEEDTKVCDVQVPELRSTLTRPRCLLDPLVYDGHTMSYDHHTVHWRLMHELPTPATVQFVEKGLTVTIWFDFCGHFTNKVYVFSSVGDLVDDTDDVDEDRLLSTNALNHRAYLKFPEELETSNEKVFEDEEEGVSLCLLLSHLQRSKGEVGCRVLLKHKDDLDSVVATAETKLGHVLITRIEMIK